MVQRFGLEPPIDVEEIAASRATVSTKRFPLEVDGLCLDLKVKGKRPKIWVAHNLHRVRRRFTLAHEIGHIIIPWHAGVIVDELDAPHRLQRGRYREMEAEANRFAAELLMPTVWVRRTIERSPHPTALMNIIVQVADVSYPAALYRVQKLSPPGFVGAEVRNDIIAWSGATRGTRAKAPAVGSRIDQMDTLILEQPQALQQGESTYLWWKVRDELVAPPVPAEPWKVILEDILASVPGEHREITRSRINAVIGGSFARTPRGTPVDTLYTTALKACQNRNDRDRWLRAIFNHPDFLDYLDARCHAHAVAR
jgi:Zn-dependent peptidase ImmA (M78 family)